MVQGLGLSYKDSVEGVSEDFAIILSGSEVSIPIIRRDYKEINLELIVCL